MEGEPSGPGRCGASRVIRRHGQSTRLALAHTFVDGDNAPLILLAPCDTWPDPLAPGRSRRVPYEEVLGFTPASRVALLYWCLLDDDDVRLQGSLQVPYR